MDRHAAWIRLFIHSQRYQMLDEDRDTTQVANVEPVLPLLPAAVALNLLRLQADTGGLNGGAGPWPLSECVGADLP
jgi:hypothetical protein